MKVLHFFVIIISLFLSACSTEVSNKKIEPIALAYVYSPRSNIDVDPTYITHINFAFGHVNDCFNGVRIENEELLKNIVALKQQKPDLKVLLSIGGWGSGNFSEMAAEEYLRKAFAVDCQRIVKDYGLDGIDIDWEYPTQNAGGRISSSPADTENFALLCRDIRKEIGNDKLLTFASPSNARYVDWKTTEPYLDFVNIMTYDLENKKAGEPPLHQAGLFRSEHTHSSSVDEGVIAHLEAGIPPHKLVLGIPFGSRGLLRGVRHGNIEAETDDYIAQWDDVAKAAWLSDKDGKFLQTYEDPRSIAYKCEYLHSKGLRGAMYWQYSSDVTGDLRKAVYEGVMKIK